MDENHNLPFERCVCIHLSPLDGATGWHVLTICLGLGGRLQSLNVENQPNGRILLNLLNMFSFQIYLHLFKTLASFIYISAGMFTQMITPAGAGLLGEQPSPVTRDSF